MLKKIFNCFVFSRLKALSDFLNKHIAIDRLSIRNNYYWLYRSEIIPWMPWWLLTNMGDCNLVGELGEDILIYRFCAHLFCAKYYNGMEDVIAWKWNREAHCPGDGGRLAWSSTLVLELHGCDWNNSFHGK